jgi:hypothetical protein
VNSDGITGFKPGIILLHDNSVLYKLNDLSSVHDFNKINAVLYKKSANIGFLFELQMKRKESFIR